MSNVLIGESADMYDPVTGRWLGVIDKNGRENFVPSYVDDGNGKLQGLSGEIYPSNVLTSPTEKTTLANLLDPSAAISRYSPSWTALLRLRSTIVAAGSLVDDMDLHALRDPLDRLMRSTAWPKIQELWVPVGAGLTGALCKIKGTTTLTMTGNNLVAGDYSRLTGITGDAVNKDILTGYTPASISSWGFGVYPLGTVKPTGTKVLMGDGSNNYVGFSAGDAKINNTTALSLPYAFRLLSVQSQASGATALCGGLQISTIAAGSGGAAPFRLLSHAGALYSNGSAGGYAAWSPVLSSNELLALNSFFDAVSFNLGRTGFSNNLVACGDSNTLGTIGGVTTAQRWTKLVADAMCATEVNKGFNNSAMSTSATGAGVGNIWVRDLPVSATLDGGAILTAMLGTNDDQYGATLAGFSSDYEIWLNKQFSMGYKHGNVLLISPFATTAAVSSLSRLAQFRDAVAALSSKYGTMYLDGYGLTLGQSFFQGDNLHLTVGGHTTFAGAVVSALSATRYSGQIRG